MANPRIEALKRKQISVWPITTLRMSALNVDTSAVWHAAAMVKEKILIGRTWPAWPTKVRVTIGSPEEMKRFQMALTKVMG